MTDTLHLDDAATNAGAMERLFLLETRTPAYGDYDEAESLRAMRIMRQVIENRLKAPRLWGAPGATTETEVIAVSSQFAGFGGYPELSADMSSLLATILKLANSAADPRRAKYARFVQDAIIAATEASPALPAYAEAAGWRTSRHSPPGANFRLIISLQGNDFYAVSPVPPMPQRTRRLRAARAK